MTKYDFEVSNDVINTNKVRLTNQLWKLIPMREHEENWEKQLNTVILEIAGLHEIFAEAPQFLQLLAKLEGLLDQDVTFNFYRKSVFECINLLQELSNGRK